MATKIVRVAKADYQAIYDNAVSKLETIEEDVKARIELEVAEHKNRLNNIIELCTEEVEVEVPDEEIIEEQPTEPVC